jgi:hypothetical protein
MLPRPAPGFDPWTFQAKTDWIAPVYPPNNLASKACTDPDGTLCGPSKTLTVPVAGGEWHGMYQNFTVGCGGASLPFSHIPARAAYPKLLTVGRKQQVGYGGACEVYSPPVSPWCSEEFYLVRQFKVRAAQTPFSGTQRPLLRAAQTP